MDELLRRNNKRLVLHLFIAVASFGAIEGLLGLTEGPPRGVALAETIAINFIIFYWIGIDSKIRNYTTSGLFRVMVVIFGVLALFYYVTRNRGTRAGLMSFVYSIVLAIPLFIVWGVSGLITSAIV